VSGADVSGPFGARLGWGRAPALLLVDVVYAYVPPGSPLDLGATGPPVVAACAQLLEAARGACIPVVHTRVGYTAGMADAGHFGRKVPALAVFAAGAPGGLGGVPPELEARPDEPVLVKQHASAFFGTSLAATLTSLRVDTVVVAGFSTSGCVRASATDAVQHGFAPLVVREACGDRTAAVHEANLHDLDAKYADVVSLLDALTHLRGEDPRG
jgi:maleamate amidohydrolase